MESQRDVLRMIEKEISKGSVPVRFAGMGFTEDYILLEDGMEIDVAMFSDWDFYHTGAFAYFTSESTNSVDSGIYNIKTNENISLTMRGTATNAANDGSSTFVGEKMPGEDVVNIVGEVLTVQEMAGFQLFIARMDDELLKYWNAPCRTPYYKN